MSEVEPPDWPRVLGHLYDHQLLAVSSNRSARGERVSERDLQDEVDLNPVELRDAIEFMEHAGLMSQKRSGHDYKITRDGFQVAHDLRMQEQEQRLEDARSRRQSDVNRAIGFLTLGLLFVTTMDVGVRGLVGMESEFWKIRGAMFLALVTTTLFAIALIRTGVLNPDE
jgi:predicted transcriptional regulator